MKKISVANPFTCPAETQGHSQEKKKINKKKSLKRRKNNKTRSWSATAGPCEIVHRDTGICLLVQSSKDGMSAEA